ncbi:MAG: nuclear transport factor 2 family protein [Pseudomonadales bacterium]|nr:nuclear transport factor 2 family protein [Pseudomonadales bacterium]
MRIVYSVCIFLLANGLQAGEVEVEVLREQVIATERAFAKTMADRDFGAFQAFLAEEAIFVSGDQVMRGRADVADAWQLLFEAPAAPFSWEPELVEVLDSGDLALSSGPVRNPQGRTVAIFNSIWRRQADGGWLIVFDRGTEVGPGHN